MEPEGTSSFPAKDSPPINPCQWRTHRVRLKVSCFALGSPVPVLHSWPQGGETATQLTRNSETATNTGPVSRVAHHAYAWVAYLLIFATQVGLTHAASLPGQRALRLGGGPPHPKRQFIFKWLGSHFGKQQVGTQPGTDNVHTGWAKTWSPGLEWVL